MSSPTSINTLSNKENYTWVEKIAPRNKTFDLRLGEVWRYRDLLGLMVRRDFVAVYKQTILGPIWFFLQPILTTIIYTVIFGKIAKIPVDGLPKMVFYLAGITMWNYFADCLTKTASVFRDNASVFGKVYFPRLIIPLSIIVSNLVKLAIQLGLFLIIWGYYIYNGANIHPNVYILLTPILIIILALMGLGSGMIITSLTTKYRDLVFLLTFGVQLLMYATPVILPMSFIPKKYLFIIHANPISSIIETFRFAFTGAGNFSWGALIYSSVFSIIILFIGMIVFNRVEKNFMDTV